MRLDIRRTHLHAEWTIGQLLVNGNFECFTLEDRARVFLRKIHGATAIFAGGPYLVRPRVSPKFSPELGKVMNDMAYKGSPMPTIFGVPMFTLTMFHWGNDKDDTEGCPLLGTSADLTTGSVRDSRKAFKYFYPKIVEAWRRDGEDSVQLFVDESHVEWDHRKNGVIG